MNKNDKERFVQIMLGMADNFRDNITKEGMTMRFDMLKDYNISQVESAAKQIMLTRKYTKMPPVAEFIEILQGGNKEDKALVIANNIISHLKTHGSRIFPKLDDPVAKHLMTKRWPYYEWAAAVIESELKWWTKEFCEAYKSYKENIMINLERIRLEKQMDAGTEIEKAFLDNYLENKPVPEKYIDYCKRWTKAFTKWDSLSDMS